MTVIELMRKLSERNANAVVQVWIDGPNEDESPTILPVENVIGWIHEENSESEHTVLLNVKSPF